MFCSNCGQQLNDNQKFCHNCGAVVGGDAPQTNDVIVETEEAVSFEPAMPSDESFYDGEEKTSFFNAYFVDPYFRHYADFGGRTSRKTFWLTYLASCVVSLALVGFFMLLCGLLGMAGLIIGSVLCGIVGLGLVIPQLAICCRRLRDSGKSPYLIFLGLIPFIGGILLLIFFCMPSAEDDAVEPQKEVKFSAIDWSIVAAAVVLPVVGVILGINQVSSFVNGADFDSVDYERYSDMYVDEGLAEMAVAEDSISDSDIPMTSGASSASVPTREFVSEYVMDDYYVCSPDGNSNLATFYLTVSPETGEGAYQFANGETFRLTIEKENSDRTEFVCSIETEEGWPTYNKLKVKISDNGSVKGSFVVDGQTTDAFSGYVGRL